MLQTPSWGKFRSPRPPRARGDAPGSTVSDPDLILSSPRTRGCSRGFVAVAGAPRLLPARGCSRVEADVGGVDAVLPARAGMLLPSRWWRTARPGPPRPRGGVPCARCGAFPGLWSSPRTPGCSRRDPHGEPQGHVLPAHPGMLPPAVPGAPPTPPRRAEALPLAGKGLGPAVGAGGGRGPSRWVDGPRALTYALTRRRVYARAKRRVTSSKGRRESSTVPSVKAGRVSPRGRSRRSVNATPPAGTSTVTRALARLPVDS